MEWQHLGIDFANLDLDGWRGVASYFAIELEFETMSDDGRLVGEIVVDNLEEVLISHVRTETPHVVRRTQDAIDRENGSNEGFYRVILQHEGTARMEQDGRNSVLSPGTIGLFDTTRPQTFAVDGPMYATLFAVPRHRIALLPSDIAETTARTFGQDTAVGRVVIPCLAELAANAAELPGAHAGAMMSAALDLFVTLLSSSVPTEKDPRRRLVRDIQTYATERLGDPDLSPTSIAQAHFISTRYLHTVFSAQGTTISAWIKARRLEQIRRELADPHKAGEALHQIAARWGLSDSARLSKVFRQAYGESPSAYRRRMHSPPDGNESS